MTSYFKNQAWLFRRFGCFEGGAEFLAELEPALKFYHIRFLPGYWLETRRAAACSISTWLSLDCNTAFWLRRCLNWLNIRVVLVQNINRYILVRVKRLQSLHCIVWSRVPVQRVTNLAERLLVGHARAAVRWGTEVSGLVCVAQHVILLLVSLARYEFFELLFILNRRPNPRIPKIRWD